MVALGTMTIPFVSRANEPTGDVVTVDRAVRMSLDHREFEQLQSARLDALSGEKRAARTFPNPTFAFDREQQWTSGEATVEDFFVLEQSLPVWGTRSLRAESVEARREAVGRANAADRLDRRLEVRRTFYATLRARRLVEVSRERLEEVESTLEIMRARQRAAEASEYAVGRLEQSRLEAESVVTEARASLVEMRGELAGLTGQAPTPLEAWSVRGELLPAELPTLEVLLERVRRKPSIDRLRAEAKSQEKRREALGRAVIPTPALRGGYKRIGGANGGPFHGLIVGVSLEVPVFDRHVGERRRATARRTRFRALAELRSHRAEAELRAAYRAADMRMRAAERYRNQAVPRVEKLLERARERYNAGIGTMFSLIDAHRRLYDTKTRAIELAWEARSAVIEVKQHAGGFP